MRTRELVRSPKGTPVILCVINKQIHYHMINKKTEFQSSELFLATMAYRAGHLKTDHYGENADLEVIYPLPIRECIGIALGWVYCDRQY